MSLKDKLFSFDGRLGLRDWWVWGILAYLVQSATQFGSAYLLGLDRYGPIGLTNAVVGDPWPVLLHSVIVTLAFTWPQLALTVKRAHDIGRGGGSFAVVWIVTGALAYWPLRNDPLARQPDLWSRLEPWAVMAVALAGLLYVFIPLGVRDGRTGANRFGPSPKAARPPALTPSAEVE